MFISIPLKVRVNKSTMRPLCKSCKTQSAAVNYIRNDKTYYRKLCEKCSRILRKEKTHNKRRSELAGYNMKPECEVCGFKPAYKEQLIVFHIDRNQQSIDTKNLKTLCLNCNYEFSIKGWARGDLLEDL